MNYLELMTIHDELESMACSILKNGETWEHQGMQKMAAKLLSEIKKKAEQCEANYAKDNQNG